MRWTLQSRLSEGFDHRVFLALLALLALFETGCGDRVSPAPRLVLLYAPCSVGKQFLSPWNESLSFTPNLAEFAAKSTVFARHQTETGQSGISYASLFSGSQADHHRVYRHPATLSDDLYLITEAYADAGYETFYWNGHGLASNKFNYAQGVPRKNIFPKRLVANDDRFVAILDRLARDPEYKAFILTNLNVTHGPYKKRHAARFIREYPADSLGVTSADVEKYANLYRKNFVALTWNHTATLQRLEIGEDLPKLASVIELLYRANVNHLDRLFGSVHDAIVAKDLMNESLIVFTADHGEVLYRESATFKWTHSMLLDHEVLGVPLIIHSPLLPTAAAPYAGVTRSTDVFPTMAGLSNIELPTDRGTRGVDLSRVLTGGLPAPDLLAYSHTTVLVKSVFRQMYDEPHARNWTGARRFFPDDSVDHIWVAVRSGDEWFKHRKLENGSWTTQAFDLATDPDANRDVFDAGDPRHVAIRDDLLAYHAMLVRTHGQSRDQAIDPPLSDQQEDELLRSLGYIE